MSSLMDSFSSEQYNSLSTIWTPPNPKRLFRYAVFPPTVAELLTRPVSLRTNSDGGPALDDESDARSKSSSWHLPSNLLETRKPQELQQDVGDNEFGQDADMSNVSEQDAISAQQQHSVDEERKVFASTGVEIGMLDLSGQESSILRLTDITMNSEATKAVLDDIEDSDIEADVNENMVALNTLGSSQTTPTTGKESCKNDLHKQQPTSWTPGEFSVESLETEANISKAEPLSQVDVDALSFASLSTPSVSATPKTTRDEPNPSSVLEEAFKKPFPVLSQQPQSQILSQPGSQQKFPDTMEISTQDCSLLEIHVIQSQDYQQHAFAKPMPRDNGFVPGSWSTSTTPRITRPFKLNPRDSSASGQTSTSTVLEKQAFASNKRDSSVLGEDVDTDEMIKTPLLSKLVKSKKRRLARDDRSVIDESDVKRILSVTKSNPDAQASEGAATTTTMLDPPNMEQKDFVVDSSAGDRNATSDIVDDGPLDNELRHDVSKQMPSGTITVSNEVQQHVDPPSPMELEIPSSIVEERDCNPGSRALASAVEVTAITKYHPCASRSPQRKACSDVVPDQVASTTAGQTNFHEGTMRSILRTSHDGDGNKDRNRHKRVTFDIASTSPTSITTGTDAKTTPASSRVLHRRTPSARDRDLMNRIRSHGLKLITISSPIMNQSCNNTARSPTKSPIASTSHNHAVVVQNTFHALSISVSSDLKNSLVTTPHVVANSQEVPSTQSLNSQIQQGPHIPDDDSDLQAFIMQVDNRNKRCEVNHRPATLAERKTSDECSDMEITLEETNISRIDLSKMSASVDSRRSETVRSIQHTNSILCDEEDDAVAADSHLQHPETIPETQIADSEVLPIPNVAPPLNQVEQAPDIPTDRDIVNGDLALQNSTCVSAFSQPLNLNLPILTTVAMPDNIVTEKPSPSPNKTNFVTKGTPPGKRKTTDDVPIDNSRHPPTPILNQRLLKRKENVVAKQGTTAMVEDDDDEFRIRCSKDPPKTIIRKATVFPSARSPTLNVTSKRAVQSVLQNNETTVFNAVSEISKHDPTSHQNQHQTSRASNNILSIPTMNKSALVVEDAEDVFIIRKQRDTRKMVIEDSCSDIEDLDKETSDQFENLKEDPVRKDHGETRPGLDKENTTPNSHLVAVPRDPGEFTQLINPVVSTKICAHCGRTMTTAWRAGPEGPETLCQKCGSHFAIHGNLDKLEIEQSCVSNANRVHLTNSPDKDNFIIRNDCQGTEPNSCIVVIPNSLTEQSVQPVESRDGETIQAISNASHPLSEVRSGQKDPVAESVQRPNRDGTPIMANAPLTLHKRANLRCGDRVWARWPADNHFYSGVVTSRSRDETVYRVDYDDGESSELTADDLRPLTLHVGDKVYGVRTKRKMAAGRIVRVHVVKGVTKYQVQFEGSRREKADLVIREIVFGPEMMLEKDAKDLLLANEVESPVPRMSVLIKGKGKAGTGGKRGSSRKTVSPVTSVKVPTSDPTRPTITRNDSRSTSGSRTPVAGLRSPTVELSDKFSALGPIPRAPIFKNIGFVLTSSETSDERTDEEEALSNMDRQDKQHIRKQIESAGGLLIDDLSQLFRGRQRIRQHPSMIVVIAPRCVRTKKFMMGLALGLPLVSHFWIRDCCVNERLENYDSYLLSNGYSKEIMMFSNARMDTSGVFKNLRIHVHGNSQWVRDWGDIASAAGAMIVPKKQMKEEPVNYVVCEKGAPRDLAFMSEAFNGGAYRIVNIEWMIQSLINQRVVQHSKYFPITI